MEWYSRSVDLEVLCGDASNEESSGDDGSRERLHGERREGDERACGKETRETRGKRLPVNEGADYI